MCVPNINHAQSVHMLFEEEVDKILEAKDQLARATPIQISDTLRVGLRKKNDRRIKQHRNGCWFFGLDRKEKVMFATYNQFDTFLKIEMYVF